GLLVARIAIRVEITDRDRVDPRLRERTDRRLEGLSRERRVDAPIETDPLLDAEPARSRNEGNGGRHTEVVAVVLEPFTHLDDVAMALGREHADGSALSLQQGVRRDRGAVDDQLRLGQESLSLE